MLAELEEELGRDDVDVVELVQGGQLVVFWPCVPQIRARRRHRGECVREKDHGRGRKRNPKRRGEYYKMGNRRKETESGGCFGEVPIGGFWSGRCSGRKRSGEGY